VAAAAASPASGEKPVRPRRRREGENSAHPAARMTLSLENIWWRQAVQRRHSAGIEEEKHRMNRAYSAIAA